MFTLAQLSDPHLGPLPRPAMSALMNKRLLGYLNWHRSRKFIHDRQALDRLVADVRAQRPDHIVVTGDLVNIGLHQEFARARDWLEQLGAPGDVTVIPGNHDAYVRECAEHGFPLWSDYMSGEPRTDDDATGIRFPFVRSFGPISLIGLSTAIPTPPFIAAGTLGKTQIDDLSLNLERLGHSGAFRLVLIHHPPLEGQTAKRRGLRDASDFEAAIGKFGAELVIHGHNHTYSLESVSTPAGSAPVIGIASASSVSEHRYPLAQYHLYRIENGANGWHCEMVVRGLTSPDGPVSEIRRIAILSER